MRHVLLCVTGLTPQVVTETVFALFAAQREQLPDEIHVVTTADGAQRIRLALLSKDPGWFARMRAEYDMPPILFTEAQVHVLHDDQGKPLTDIRTAEDNVTAANQLAELVRGFTQDPQTALHVSLAGGRKTLGFFAGYALGLFARPQDRLSHVLASEPFESSWDFFYPTRQQRIIRTRDDKLADCATAQVALADIPFVRLRKLLPKDKLSQFTSFADLVKAAQGHVGPARLTLDLAGRRIITPSGETPLPTAELAFLAWFARRAQQGLPAIPAPLKAADELAYADAYLREQRRIKDEAYSDGRTAARLARGMDKDFFVVHKSKVKKALHEALGVDASDYEISGEGGRNKMTFALRLPPNAINFLED